MHAVCSAAAIAAPEAILLLLPHVLSLDISSTQWHFVTAVAATAAACYHEVTAVATTTPAATVTAATRAGATAAATIATAQATTVAVAPVAVTVAVDACAAAAAAATVAAHATTVAVFAAAVAAAVAVQQQLKRCTTQSLLLQLLPWQPWPLLLVEVQMQCVDVTKSVIPLSAVPHIVLN
jgi:hypothetical protein